MPRLNPRRPASNLEIKQSGNAVALRLPVTFVTFAFFHFAVRILIKLWPVRRESMARRVAGN